MIEDPILDFIFKASQEIDVDFFLEQQCQFLIAFVSLVAEEPSKVVNRINVFFTSDFELLDEVQSAVLL